MCQGGGEAGRWCRARRWLLLTAYHQRGSSIPVGNSSQIVGEPERENTQAARRMLWICQKRWVHMLEDILTLSQVGDDDSLILRLRWRLCAPGI
jgi:hypothetical protein